MSSSIIDQLIMVARVLLAGALSAIIGYQREKWHKPAGLRTHILIGMGSALFTVISVTFTGGDPSRIAAGVVTGIGFLGAGAIIHRTRAVEGLTTAASIWVTAAIGMACGDGYYIIAAATALMVFLVLLLHHHDENDESKKGK